MIYDDLRTKAFSSKNPELILLVILFKNPQIYRETSCRETRLTFYDFPYMV
jgi:hypothetical protein